MTTPEDDSERSLSIEDSDLYLSFMEELKASELPVLVDAVVAEELSPKEFQKLVYQRIDEINVPEDLYQFTPLHIAVIKNNKEYVKALLKAPKIDVNATASGNTTALIFASDFGYAGLCKMLMKNKAIDINLTDAENNSALTFALDRWRLDIVDILLGKDNKIEEGPISLNLFYKLVTHHEFGASGDEAVALAKKLRKHGANFDKVFNDLQYIHMYGLHNGGVLEQTITRGNPELLQYFLNEFRERFSVKHLEELWRINIQILYLLATQKKQRSQFAINDHNEVSKILTTFIKQYEQDNMCKVKMLTRIVGNNRI